MPVDCEIQFLNTWLIHLGCDGGHHVSSLTTENPAHSCGGWHQACSQHLTSCALYISCPNKDVCELLVAGELCTFFASYATPPSNHRINLTCALACTNVNELFFSFTS